MLPPEKGLELRPDGPNTLRERTVMPRTTRDYLTIL